MFDCIRVKKGTTERLTATFVDATGDLKDGLTVTVRVIRSTDDKYLKNDGTWTAAPSTEYSAAELDGTNMPGVYYFDLSLPDAIDQYLVRFDGSADAANRYQFARIEAVRLDEEDLQKAKAALVNKQKQTIADGVVTIYDDDGTTSLVTMTPGVDDVDNPTENILTPS
ncbi:MAG: hypothetical protein JXQ75_07030 [Phycisphaerae bacterium]|nr:hypothetical protein [Phycisphaerae bacterium]